MPLTDVKIRALKPGAKAYKKADSGGLYLLITAAKTDPETGLTTGGAKPWRMNYRFGGKRKTMAFGVYPTVGLAEAREQRDAAKKLLRQGIDPGAERKERKAAERQAVTTFKTVSAEWHRRKVVDEGKAASTVYRARWLLDILDAGIGHRPIGEIEAPELLAVLRKIEAQEKHETVKRLRATASSVFRFGIATGDCVRDPAADLKGALTSVKATPRAAIVHPAEVGKLLRAINGIEKPGIRLPLQLLALTFVRPGELCSAEWGEFDFDAGTWTIPASKTKMRVEHRIRNLEMAAAR
jgi:Arm DNA-binding domain/Phage integrase family